MSKDLGILGEPMTDSRFDLQQHSNQIMKWTEKVQIGFLSKVNTVKCPTNKFKR